MYCTNCGCEVAAGAPFCPGCGITAPGMSPTPLNASFHAPPAGSADYAGFWLRLAAYLLDSVLFSFFALLLLLPLFALAGISNIREIDERTWLRGTMFFLWAAFILIAAVGSWLYHTGLECSSWQGTPGKKVLGLAVTDLNGRRIGFGRANARFWSKILSGFMYIGFIMIGFTDRKQGLHDMIAGTLVVRK